MQKKRRQFGGVFLWFSLYEFRFDEYDELF